MAIAYYFAEKKSGNKIALQKIRLLSSKIKIAGITESCVKSAAENVKIHDFEDGIQYYSALHSKCTFLITENKEDFYFSEIAVLDAKSFLEKTFVK